MYLLRWHGRALPSLFTLNRSRVSWLSTLPRVVLIYLTNLDPQTLYLLDEGSITKFHRGRIMAQNLHAQQMPLGIQRSRSRLGELLAADTLVAAGSATLITPAVMIFDR